MRSIFAGRLGSASNILVVMGGASAALAAVGMLTHVFLASIVYPNGGYEYVTTESGVDLAQTGMDYKLLDGTSVALIVLAVVMFIIATMRRRREEYIYATSPTN